ncbi:hypothetical protein I2I11_00250 [Pontibacter sp. 172403-2]|uniref:hypothetical protein n=1 Tax=Pontibacter rufus TaxID=2791028 RepID=UPI0018AFAA79|nr:hypothetical protein [Pontibacter sp. 172403-2]MBF9251715.1 hypothetical protein [Pontibacter sp. 172403-2]
MMQAFLLLDLTATTAFRQPLLAQVKQVWPEVAALDADAASGELLLHYALRLLRDADKAVVLVQADESMLGFGNAMPLIEELLLPQDGRVILLLGRYPRLERMLQARPYLVFKQVEDEAEALEELALYLS